MTSKVWIEPRVLPNSFPILYRGEQVTLMQLCLMTIKDNVEG